MSLLTKTNLKEHCRTCLKILTGSTQSEPSESHTDVPESKNIHFNISNDPEMQHLICINVDGSSANEPDNPIAHDYPENVCLACYNKLYSFAIFRRRAQQSAEKLRIVLNCSGNIKVEINFEESEDEPDKSESVGASYQACKFQLHDATAESEETFFDTSAANLADVEFNEDTGDPFSPSAPSVTGSMDCDFTDEEAEEKYDEDMIAIEKKVTKEDPTSHIIITRQKAEKKIIVKQNARKPKPPKEIKKDKHRCPQCNQGFAKSVELTEHVNQVHPAGSTPFLCDYCDKSYRNLRTLKEHVLDMHQAEIKAQEHFQCTKCSTAYLDKTEFKKHMSLHSSGKKTKVCGICGESFALKKWLMEHLRTHTPDGRIPCWQCDKTYTTSDALENHERAVHLKEKPHYCAICDKYLQNKQSFRIHNYRHSGKKPHLCDICGKDFRQRTQMKTHRLTHFKNETSDLV